MRPGAYWDGESVQGHVSMLIPTTFLEGKEKYATSSTALGVQSLVYAAVGTYSIGARS